MKKIETINVGDRVQIVFSPESVAVGFNEKFDTNEKAAAAGYRWTWLFGTVTEVDVKYDYVDVQIDGKDVRTFDVEEIKIVEDEVEVEVAQVTTPATAPVQFAQPSASTFAGFVKSTSVNLFEPVTSLALGIRNMGYQLSRAEASSLQEALAAGYACQTADGIVSTSTWITRITRDVIVTRDGARYTPAEWNAADKQSR